MLTISHASECCLLTAPANNTQCSSRMLTGQKPSGAGGREEGYREAGGRKERECLRGFVHCCLLDRPAQRLSESLKIGARAFGPLHRSFWKFKRFYTQIQDFWTFLRNASVLAIPSPAFSTWEDNWLENEGLAPLKQACSQLESALSPTLACCFTSAKITPFCYQLGLYPGL